MVEDELFAQVGVDFRPEQRSMFLQEMAAAALDYKTSLGPNDPGAMSPGQLDETDRQVQELLQELGEERAGFSPRLDVVPIRLKDAALQPVRVSPRIADLQRHFNFFLVQVPVTLVPKKGWAFNALECILAFNPGRPASERPVAYQIFPQETWQNLIGVSQTFDVGLDANLEVQTELRRVGVELGQWSANVQAKAGVNTGASTRLVVGPFKYSLRRPQIITRGYRDVQVHWILESDTYVEREEVGLGVVLQVPRAVSRVDIIGVLSARRSFSLFTLDFQRLLAYVRDRTGNFFRQGAPMTGKAVWSDITAGM